MHGKCEARAHMQGPVMRRRRRPARPGSDHDRRSRTRRLRRLSEAALHALYSRREAGQRRRHGFGPLRLQAIAPWDGRRAVARAGKGGAWGSLHVVAAGRATGRRGLIPLLGRHWYLIRSTYVGPRRTYAPLLGPWNMFSPPPELCRARGASPAGTPQVQISGIRPTVLVGA